MDSIQLRGIDKWMACSLVHSTLIMLLLRGHHIQQGQKTFIVSSVGIEFRVIHFEVELAFANPGGKKLL